MRGFFVIGFKKAVEHSIDLSLLERALTREKLQYVKRDHDCSLYDFTFGYQIFEESEFAEIESSHYISGSIFGNFSRNNRKKLSYQTSIELLNSLDLAEKHELIEGNALICSVFKNKIIFQNDLEGYRRIFYYRDKNVVCITNQLPLILKVIKRNWTIRKRAVVNYLLRRESKWPLTFVDDIYVLSPLSYAVVDQESIKIASKTFSDLYTVSKTSRADLKGELLREYQGYIDRFESKNVAVTLSGGYDSNCITKLYNDAKRADFTAVSLGYISERTRDSNIYNETTYAKRTAERLNIRFKAYVLSKDEFFSELDDFLEAIDQPGHDPSSNFILNKYVNRDGFNTIVNGMGGDACFANKSHLRNGLNLYKFLKSKKCANAVSLAAKLLSYRGVFHYMKYYKFGNVAPQSFHDLYERIRLLSSPLSRYVNSKELLELESEQTLRKPFFSKLYDQAKTEQEIFYSLALFCNPDEYHAALMAERIGNEIVMPFIHTKAAVLLMNGSYWQQIDRQFEAEIFGGIDKDLLVKKKSGLSIPYTEWIEGQENEVFDFYLDSKFFTRDDFDIESFYNVYHSDTNFANSLTAKMTLWKLLIVKLYMEKHSLQLK